VLARAEDGALVQIDLPDRWLDALRPAWPPTGLAEVGDDHTAADLCVALLEGPDSEPICEVDGVAVDGGWLRVGSTLALFAAEHLAARVAIHAGVAARGGRAIVLPGPSFAGKSTLCAALGEAGATVLTDELALVDPSASTVTGWHRPLRLRQPDGSVRSIQLAETDGVALDVSALVFPVYEADTDEVIEVEPLTPGDAVLALLANTVSAQVAPERAFDTAVALARSAPAVRIRHRDAAAVADLLLSSAARPPSRTIRSAAHGRADRGA
jgi:hypothetical protein